MRNERKRTRVRRANKKQTRPRLERARVLAHRKYGRQHRPTWSSTERTRPASNTTDREDAIPPNPAEADGSIHCFAHTTIA